jgi:hypothetical protein
MAPSTRKFGAASAVSTAFSSANPIVRPISTAANTAVVGHAAATNRIQFIRLLGDGPFLP